MLKLSQKDYLCSQTWLPTVQEVLHADWQDAGHSPQPPVLKVLLSIALFTVVMCFFIVHSSKKSLFILLYRVLAKMASTDFHSITYTITYFKFTFFLK